MGFHISFTVFHPLLVLLLALCTFKCSKACVERERVALLDFKTSFTSSSQNREPLSFWNSSEDCCSWEGITCDSHSKHVVTLSLQYCDSYQLRPSLVELQQLRELQLTENILDMRIPKFIGSLSKLTYLELSASGLFGMIPTQLGNLSNLQFLDLDWNCQLSTNNFQWLSHLSSLNSLHMSCVNFSEARDYLSTIINLPSLSEFSCDSCYFPTDPDMSSHVNSSSSLRELYLPYSTSSSTVLSLLINSTKNLEKLGISGNLLDEGVFSTIGNLCTLKELYAQECTSKESLANIVQALSTCASRSLELMDLSSMNLTGTIPSMSKFQSLTTLDLSGNFLDSLPPPNGGFPANLSVLFLENNNLNGVLSDLHFANMSQLQILKLSHNHNLTCSFNEPLVRAILLNLRYCNLGPNFPSGLLALNSIDALDISNCKISSNVPSMFWMNITPNITYLNLSSNSLSGVVPDISFQFTSSSSCIDLSSNAFSGPIPFFLFTAIELTLSNNLFSKFASVPHPYFLSPITDSLISFKAVDISNNHLSGLIPHWMGLQKSLGGLILANNNLSGPIPSSIGQAVQLYVLNLGNNNLSGPLPSFLKNCSELRILDLGGNHFYGFIPSWMGENLKNLSVLSLRSNSMMGILPTSLCHLSSLQIIDISQNLLSGNIPSCIHEFSAMTHEANSSLEVSDRDNGEYISDAALEDVSFYNAYIEWKSKVWKFQSTLHLVKLLDLSSNNLTGEIPTGLASLVELDSIDLSCNNLQGSIPVQIGQLKSLQYLNLSSNRLGGQIPQSLSEIYALEMLNLSHNNLSGRIPKSTQLQSFEPSAFVGNEQLCGLPLRKCPGDGGDPVQPPPPSPTDDGEMQGKRVDKEWFYAGLGAGFACGFFGILGTLTCITAWRHAFFHFASEFGEWILLVLALSKSKISRKIGLK